MSISPSQRSRTALGIGIVVGLAVVVVGSFIVFGGGGDEAAPTTTVPPVVDPNAPPELKNTGEDWDTIVRSVVAYEGWLFNHPDPALAGNYKIPSGQLFDDTLLGLSNLATKGWRYDPPRPQLAVESVRFRERPSDSVVVLFVRFGATGPTRVVDVDGKVIQDTPGSPANAVLWTLVREPSTDPHWRLFKVTPFTTEPGPAPA